MLRGASFLGMLRHYRIMWVGGRYGGGKTAFMTRIAYEFFNRGWSDQIIANFPCVLATDLERVQTLENTVILADEAGLWITDKTFGNVTAFLRKYNCYLFMASVMPVPIRARSLNVQRDMNLNSIGLPIWRYSCVLDYMRVKEKFSIQWVYPSEIFGLYDTSYPADDDMGIVDFVNEWVEKDVAKRKAEAGVKDYRKRDQAVAVSAGRRDEDVDALRWIAEANYEAAQKIEEAVSLGGGKTRRRRR